MCGEGLRTQNKLTGKMKVSSPRPYAKKDKS